MAIAKTNAPSAINAAGRPSKLLATPACVTSESNPFTPDDFTSCRAIFSKISWNQRNKSIIIYLGILKKRVFLSIKTKLS